MTRDILKGFSESDVADPNDPHVVWSDGRVQMLELAGAAVSFAFPYSQVEWVRLSEGVGIMVSFGINQTEGPTRALIIGKHLEPLYRGIVDQRVRRILNRSATDPKKHPAEAVRVDEVLLWFHPTPPTEPSQSLLGVPTVRT